MGKLMHVCRWCLFFLINSADFNFFVNECLFWPITHKYMFYYTLKPLTWTKSTDVQSCCCFNCLGFEIIELVRNWFPACGIGPICELQDNSHTGITKFFNKRKKKKKICYTKLYLFFQIFLMKYCLIAAEIIFKWRNLRKRNQSMNELLITDLHALVETINVLCKSLIWCVAFSGVMEQIADDCEANS